MDPLILFFVVTKYFLMTTLFQVKHYVADYPLQLKFDYMLGKFKPGWDFVGPLGSHVAVHGIMTVAILGYFCSFMSWGMILLLAVLDMAIHFTMDRIKASPHIWGKFKTLTKRDFEEYTAKIQNYAEAKAADPYFAQQMDNAPVKAQTEWAQRRKDNYNFWNSLGIDQFIHHMTDNIIVYVAMLMMILGL
jgi:hypothetical protein